MNAKTLALLLSVQLLFAAASQAQFYAPETDYHDMAQREFVVELARVLAWRENLAGKKIAEITYTVATDDAGKTNWEVQWLDAQGKELRHFAVTYKPDLLTSGPAFYRTVFKQMAGDPAEGELTAADLIKSYWKGADSSGYSRTESLRAAFDLLAAKAPETEYAPKLAGLLVHTALPTVASTLSLDAVAIARGAAWLCVAESYVKKPDAEMDTLWAPTLFLANRQNAAMDLWKKSAKTNASAGEGDLFQWWSLIMRRPLGKEVFLYAADHRKFAMPMLVYTSSVTGLDFALAELVEPLFSGGEKTLQRLYDYSRFMSRNGGIDGGRILEGAWPALARRDWIECLAKLQPEPLDYSGYLGALKKLKNEQEPQADDNSDASLLGLADQAPLLDEGFREGTGKLIPVAAVTARDLLNYGWEMTCAQMAARQAFVKYAWGVKDLGDAIALAVKGNVPGADIFFIADPLLKYQKTGIGGANAPATELKDWKRLEGMDVDSEWLAVSGIWGASMAENVETLARRCWLRTGYARDISSFFYHTGQFDKILPNLRRMHEEGGPLCDSHVLAWFAVDLRPDGAKRVPGNEAVKAEFAQNLPEPTHSQITVLWPAKYDKMPDFQRGQDLEKTFWLRPGSDMPYEAVFDAYIRSHAYASARRFYDQTADLLDERVGFSNGFGPHRLVLALLEKDNAAVEKALRDSDTGSYESMNMARLVTVVRDDAKATLQQTDEMIERYGDKKNLDQIKQFLPLIPALKDPAHPDHARALDFFAKNKEFATFQWFWLANCKLTTEDAVRFLGGKDTDPQRRMLVFYLLKDKEGFEKTYDEFGKDKRFGGWGALYFVLIHYLRNDLLDIPVPAEQPDLKPTQVETISQAVKARLDQSKKAVAEEPLESKNADDLWAHIQDLQANPGQFTAREEVEAYFDKVLAATKQFIKDYPDDKRKWDARIVAAEAGAQLAQMSGGQIDRAGFQATMKEVAGASQASADTRAEARVTLIQLHLEDAQTSDDPKAFPAVEDEIAAFTKDFPADPRGGDLQMLRVDWYRKKDPARATSLLNELAKSGDPHVAARAQGQLRILALPEKPFDLKFTAADGAPVDVAKMKGKVVLVDFWATWCGPCMRMMPKLVELYQKYHASGLEIVGVSLDEDKDRFLSVTKLQGMAWPEFFDGKGWENGISTRYDIRAIPRLFIANKKGFVVQTEEPEDLDATVAKLLAE